MSQTLSSVRARRLYLLGLVAAAVASTTIVAVSAGVAAAAASGLAWITLGLLFKSIAEIDGRSRLLAQRTNAYADRLGRVEETNRQSRTNVDRAASTAQQAMQMTEETQEALGHQASSNNAIAERLIGVEQAATDQTGFNNAIVRRVRTLEKSSRGVNDFNEAVLNRVRALEAALPQAPRRTEPISPAEAERLEKARASIRRARSTALTHTDGLAADSDDPEPSIAQRSRESTTAPDVLVSVVVPCHNTERYVGAALESVRHQTFSAWECIVVDDGSSDRSLDAIRRAVASDERFRVVEHSTTRGAAAARNSGIESARGQLITFLDADDLLMADSLLDRVETFAERATPDIAGAFCGVRTAPEDVGLESLPAREPWRGPAFVDFLSSAGECPFNIHAPLVRAGVVRDAGGFSEAIRVGSEDWDLWARIMRRGYVFVPSDARTAVYRMRSGSVSQQPLPRSREAATLVHSAYEETADAGEATAFPFPQPLPYYQELVAVADRTVMYVALALTRSDMEGAEAVAATLGPGTWPLLERHIDFERWAGTGFSKGFGLDAAAAQTLEDDLAPLLRAVIALVRSATASASGDGQAGLPS